MHIFLKKKMQKLWVLLQGIYQSVKKPMCHFQMFKNRHDLSLGHAGCNFYQFQYLEQFRTVFGNILLTFFTWTPNCENLQSLAKITKLGKGHT